MSVITAGFEAIFSPGFNEPFEVVIDPADTYLRRDAGDPPDAEQTRVDLETIDPGVFGGQLVVLFRVGDYATGGPGSTDEATDLLGVFSASETLLGIDIQDRVQDAIDAGRDIETGNVVGDPDRPSDIAEDFFIPGDEGVAPLVLEVPATATDLFLSVNDSFYSDNEDPNDNFRLLIYPITGLTITGTEFDDFLVSPVGANVIDGGEGFDTVAYVDATGPVAASLADGTGTVGDAEGDTYESIEALEGSNGPDTLQGSDEGNFIRGLGGADEIEGRGSNNFYGGEIPEFAGDTYFAVDPSDLFGIFSRADGQVDVDFDEPSGAVTLIDVTGAEENSTFFLDQPAQGPQFFDAVVRFDGFTVVVIPSLINGDDEGRDINGSDQADTISAGGGDDSVRPFGGADNLDGGDGYDFLDHFFSPAAVSIDLGNETDPQGGAPGSDSLDDIVSGFEAVGGSRFDDTLTGDDNGNNLNGGPGADLITGNGQLNFYGGGFSDFDGDTYGGVDSSDIWGIFDRDEGEVVATFDEATGEVTLTDLRGELPNATFTLLQPGAQQGDAVTENEDQAQFFNVVVRFDGFTVVVLPSIVNGDDEGRLLNGDDADDNGTAPGGGDVIFAGGGDDVIRPFGGGDFVDGGEGFDTIDYSFSRGAISIDLTDATGPQGGAPNSDSTGDTLVSIENVEGSRFDDVIVGTDDLGEGLRPGPGADTVTGGSGPFDFFGGQIQEFEGDLFKAAVPGGTGLDIGDTIGVFDLTPDQIDATLTPLGGDTEVFLEADDGRSATFLIEGTVENLAAEFDGFTTRLTPVGEIVSGRTDDTPVSITQGITQATVFESGVPDPGFAPTTGEIVLTGAGTEVQVTNPSAYGFGANVDVGVNNPGGSGYVGITGGATLRTLNTFGGYDGPDFSAYGVTIGEGDVNLGRMVVDGPGSRLITEGNSTRITVGRGEDGGTDAGAPGAGFGPPAGAEGDAATDTFDPTGFALPFDPPFDGIAGGGPIQGELKILNGGYANTIQLELGRDGGRGLLTIDGPGSTLAVNDANARFQDSYFGEGGFANVGRSGGTGYFSVTNGGRLLVDNTDGETDNPILRLARDSGDYGFGFVSGAGSSLDIIQRGPAGDSYGFIGSQLIVGRGGQGIVEVTDGAEINVLGDRSLVEIAQETGGTTDGTASRLEVTDGATVSVLSDTQNPFDYNSGEVRVGFGNGILAVHSGGLVQARELTARGEGRVEVSDAGSIVITPTYATPYQSVTANNGGEIAVSGTGSILATGYGGAGDRGAGRFQIGRDGAGTLSITDGGYVGGFFFEFGRTGQGVVNVSGDGSELRGTDRNGTFRNYDFANYEYLDETDDATFLRIGRAEGGRAEVNVTDGGLVSLYNRPFGGKTEPGIQIARLGGSEGILNITGAGSEVQITQNGPSEFGGIFKGAFVDIGASNVGDGNQAGKAVVNVTDGGLLLLQGEETVITVGENAPTAPPVEGETVTDTGFDEDAVSELNVQRLPGDDDGGKVRLISRAVNEGAFLTIANEAGSQGRVIVDGEGAELSLISDLNRAAADTQLGSIATVGQFGQGELRVTDGAEMVIDGGGGRFPGLQVGFGTGGGYGETGSGSGEVLISDAEMIFRSDRGFEDGGFFGAFINVGRADGAEGTLRIDDGGAARFEGRGDMVVNIGRDQGSSGRVEIGGEGSLLDLGSRGIVLVSGDGAEDFADASGPLDGFFLTQGRGEATLEVRDGGTVRADEIVVGENGEINLAEGQLEADLRVLGGDFNVGGTLGGIGLADIAGNFAQPSGKLGFEVVADGGGSVTDAVGPGANAFDRLLVSGDAAIAADTIDIDLSQAGPLGFGDALPIIEVHGSLDLDVAQVDLSGLTLPPGLVPQLVRTDDNRVFLRIDEPGKAVDATLEPGELEEGQFGNAYNGATDADGLLHVTFDRPEGSVARISARGFDIDTPTEVEVLLNGQSLGFLEQVRNNLESLELDIFEVDAETLLDEDNVLTFRQTISPSFRWGVTDLLVEGTGQEDPEGMLAFGETRDGAFGNAFATETDRDGVVAFSFPGAGADLSLDVLGFDIDTTTEVEVFLNGESRGFVDNVRNNAVSDAPNTFTIPQSDQLRTLNEIAFVQTVSPIFKWGVTDITLTPDGDTADFDGLVPGVTDTRSFGRAVPGATDVTDGTISASFEGTGEDVTLSFDGFDFDGDRIEAFLNGRSLGLLPLGVNEGNAPYSLDIAAVDQVDGTNLLTLTTGSPQLKWGVSNLRIDPVAPDFELRIGEVVEDELGNGSGPGFDGGSEPDGRIRAGFDSRGTDLTLTVTGFDVDTVTEIEVLLNGASLGFLEDVQNNGFSEPQSFPIPLADQLPTGNEITFQQTANPGFLWGVTDISLTTALAADLQLTPGVEDLTRFGNAFEGVNDTSGTATVGFEGTGQDYQLAFDGFDVDAGERIEVLFNGESVTFLEPGINNARARYLIFIEGASQVLGENTVTFVQRTNPNLKWGVADFLLQEVQQTDIELALGRIEDGSFGNNFDGATDDDGILTAGFDGTDRPLFLSFEGFDIDNGSEIELFLNGDSLGFIDGGVNDGFESYVIEIPAEDQRFGQNVITFEQQQPIFKWGITDLLLDDQPPADILLEIGELEDGEFGNRTGGPTDIGPEVTAGFEGTGTDLVLSFLGFDIDNGSEIELLLNGESLGFLPQGVNDQEQAYEFEIPAESQVEGRNILTFFQSTNEIFKWGVSDILLEESSATDGASADLDSAADTFLF